MNFLPFLIAKKIYLAQNKNHIILLISILSKIGISISTFALIMSFSALNGFEQLLNKTILSTFPHGIIQINDQSSFTSQEIIQKLKYFPKITYSEPYIVCDALIITNKKIKPIKIKSFSNIKYIKKDFFKKDKKDNSIKEKNDNNSIILSSDLVKHSSMKIGDYVNLIILDQKKKMFQPHLRYFSLKITNIFKSNGILDSNISYIPFNFFQETLNIKNIDTIELYMSDPFHANKIILDAAKQIRAPLFLYTWINSYKDIYNNIKIIKSTVYLTLLLLILVSCFSTASISLMTVSKKTRDIAILRSMGANNFFIQLIFLYYGLRYIIVGSIIGLFSGVITILNFEKIIFFLEKYLKENIFFDNVYYNNFLLLKLDILDIFIIFISTIVLGIITNFYPIYYASKINSSEILKHY